MVRLAAKRHQFDSGKYLQLFILATGFVNIAWIYLLPISFSNMILMQLFITLWYQWITGPWYWVTVLNIAIDWRHVRLKGDKSCEHYYFFHGSEVWRYILRFFVDFGGKMNITHLLYYYKRPIYVDIGIFLNIISVDL